MRDLHADTVTVAISMSSSADTRTDWMPRIVAPDAGSTAEIRGGVVSPKCGVNRSRFGESIPASRMTPAVALLGDRTGDLRRGRVRSVLEVQRGGTSHVWRCHRGAAQHGPIFIAPRVCGHDVSSGSEQVQASAIVGERRIVHRWRRRHRPRSALARRPPIRRRRQRCRCRPLRRT